MITTRADRHPDGPHHARLGRHRPRARRRRHDGFALAAARRLGRRTRPPIELVDKAQTARRRAARGRRGRHRARQGRRRVPRRRHAGGGEDLGRPAPRHRAGRRSADRSTPVLQRQRRHVPVRRPRRRRRGRHATPARCKHLRQVACDDAGRVLNPMLLEGQIHGGIAQGAAQALLEEVRYDDDGNPVTSNLADYGMISAAELPSFEVVHMETPTFRQPARRQGHRRVGHDRFDARRAVGRRRRRRATSASATSTCPPPPSGSGRPSTPQGDDRGLALRDSPDECQRRAIRWGVTGA